MASHVQYHGMPCNAKNTEYWHLTFCAFLSYMEIKWKGRGCRNPWNSMSNTDLRHRPWHTMAIHGMPWQYMECHGKQLIGPKYSWRAINWSTGRSSSIGSEMAWHASGPEFDPHVRHILSWRLGHENISTAVLPLPLMQEEQLSVTGKRMCTKYW